MTLRFLKKSSLKMAKNLTDEDFIGPEKNHTELAVSSFLNK